MTDTMTEPSSNGTGGYERIRYEVPIPMVARITLARADKRNAQDRQLLYELNDGFDRAMRDNDVKVVILAADGPDFSSGHDLSDVQGYKDRSNEHQSVTPWSGFDLPGVEGSYAMEQEAFIGLCWRWRNLPKVTIAQVQGRAIAGGIMLVWPCDLIVASEDATFSDPVVAFGVTGHEYFTHVWELGARQAKEMLFTGEPISAQDGYRLGMVNHVVPLDKLEAYTLDLARQITRRPGFALKLAKAAVNQSLDIQGQYAAIQAAHSLHTMGHAHTREVPFDGRELVRESAKSVPRSARQP